MEFKIKEWRTYYDNIHALGKMLKDAHYDSEGNPPVNRLSRHAQVGLELEISVLMAKSDKYLDQCNIRNPEPLWHYHKEDPTTHPSSDHFSYLHLI